MTPQRTAAAPVVASAILAVACSSEPAPSPTPADLPLGQMTELDRKADGHWGHALDCKTIPDVPALEAPHVTISLDGLSLRLVDRAGDYDRVFPVGVGAINENKGEATFGDSLSYFPVIATGSKHFTIDTTDTGWEFMPCRSWWTSSDTGERLPVFAGLPFIRFHGPYGIHGPVTNYRQADGGDLVRGYVSHGCIRMEGADVRELYARIRGRGQVPVTLQHAPIRDASGERRDPRPWIGTECASDGDCSFDGGVCEPNLYTGRGFCTVECDRLCPDRFGDPGTLCVSAPTAAEPGRGICVPREEPENAGCRPYDHLAPTAVPRVGEPDRAFEVCMPGSRGWVGDRCFPGDCRLGSECVGAAGAEPGVCTMGCDRFCPDAPGRPLTLCVDGELGGPSCLRQCDPGNGGDACAAGFVCASQKRYGDPESGEHWVCVPEEE